LVDRFLWLVDYAKSATVVVERPAEVSGRLAQGISLEAVSFSYPSTNVEVLHDISLDLPAGTIVALVGDNGAGKTTLVKLLTGMYQPTSGRILVDGTPLENIEPRAWREHLSAAFQDFTRFELTLQESVGVGDLAHVEDTEPVLEGLALADGADLPSQLPSGLATELGASFEHGVQLSGGQWQKVALGRAMMRTSPLLLILDEPTASLDPSAEQHLFNRYSDLSRRAAITSGAITILISHRFSTVRMADLIVVVDDGRVVEMGTHADLVNVAGMYAELYALQAASYR
jgi:ATP-binding cassette subfamily B protein